MTTATEMVELLRVAPVLASLPEDALQAVARRVRVVDLRAQDLLWRQGAPAQHLALVVQGRLAIERGQGKRLLVDLCGPHALLGEVAFSLDASYQFDVRCLRKARVALIPAALMREHLRTHPDVAIALSMELAREVMRLTRRLEALSAGSVEQRLARVLVSLTERFGSPFPGGVLMPARLRREDLAALAATTLESASRQISKWKAQGVLLPQPVGFLVKDLPRLRELSGI